MGDTLKGRIGGNIPLKVILAGTGRNFNRSELDLKATIRRTTELQKGING